MKTKESRTYTKLDSAMKYLFVVFVLGIVILPLLAMPWAFTASTSENRTLAEKPQLITDNGSFNIEILKDTGAFFEDHFAFRNSLVSANASIRSMLGVSATDQVIVGKEDWLFYSGTLADYTGESALSERALYNIAHNMALMQGFAHAYDAQFVFAVAPNKNSLYPDYMPYYMLPATVPSNWVRLIPYLQEQNVNYVDLFKVFKEEEQSLYYAGDTHWNNVGALQGGNAILESLGCMAVSISDDAWSVRKDYVGDLRQMLYPDNPEQEVASYAQGYNDAQGQTGALWSFKQGKSVEDGIIQTTKVPGFSSSAASSEALGAGLLDSGSGTKFSAKDAEKGADSSLVMYRDSFANALIPYYASSFDKAVFTKLVPYDAATITMQNADYCIVERAERHLDYLACNAPIMPAPAARLDLVIPNEDSENAKGTRLQSVQDGSYTVLSGELDNQLFQNDVKIYIEAPTESGEMRLYEASTISAKHDMSAVDDIEIPLGADEASQEAGLQSIIDITSDYGFVAYLPGERDFSNTTLRVICIQDSAVIGIKSFVL